MIIGGHFAVLLTISGLTFAQEPVVQAPPNGELGRAWDTLRTGVRDSDPAHRKKALAAACTIGAVPEGVQMVEEALADKDKLVRQAAATALGEMGAREAIPRLKAALDDSSPEVGFSAAKALWTLGDTSSREIFQQVITGERNDAPGKLSNALHDAKKKLRPEQLALMGANEAAGLLGPASIGLTAVEEAVKESKKGGGSPGRAVAAGVLATDADPYALTLLEWALGDSSPAVRVAVAKALGERGNRETIPKLAPWLSDGPHEVRYMVAATIIRLHFKTSGGHE